MLMFISMLGLTALVLLFSSLYTETRERQQRAARLLHTKFVSPRKEIDDICLCTTQVTIGRQWNRNDICLRDLPDSGSISRMHAVIWWAGNGFRIAPVYTRRWWKLSRPEVRVGGELAPYDTGLPLPYGKLFEISGHYFMLENTDPKGSMPYFGDLLDISGAQSPVARRRRRVVRRARTAPREVSRGMRIAAAAAAVCLVLSLAGGAVAAAAWLEPPAAGDTIGQRKNDTATILVCGTDADGERTDTMMLCYLSGSEERIGILSLPRDTLTIGDNGSAHRLNSVYNRSGRGEAGMEALMEHVSRLIGYRPDGYVVFSWELVMELVDQMGGVDVTLSQDMTVGLHGEAVTVPAGEQHLNGEQVLSVLRFRSYKNSAKPDVTRTGMQRKIVKACLEQWITLEKLPKLFEQTRYVLDQSQTDLELSSVAWAVSCYLLNQNSMELSEDALPTNAVTRGDAAYLVADKDDLLTMVNGAYNPYDIEITEEYLQLAD